MKTRIVYPDVWLDKGFAACSGMTKLLFCYLTNNHQLKLSRYVHITDRQIMFDTGMTVNQLQTGKEELSNIRWCFFAEDWVYQNHKAAYVDYEGRDRVIDSKNREIENVPEEIKQVFNGLITGYEPVLNHKSETINNKEDRGAGKETKSKKNGKAHWSERIITEDELENVALDLGISVDGVIWEYQKIKDYCDSSGTQYVSYIATLRNWLRRDAEKLKANQMKGSYGRPSGTVVIPVDE